MNKRGAVFLIALFLLVPNVFANIEIDSGLSNSYNLGDSLSISGSITLSVNTDLFMETAMTCGSSSRVMMRKVVSVYSNIPKDFNQTLQIFGFESGTCQVDITLKDANNSFIETSSSNNFEITKKLIGHFTKNKEKAQLGQSVSYTGDVLTQSGKNVNGYALINLKQGDEVFYSDSTDIKNGDFAFEIKLESYPAGKVTFEATVFDIYGNSGIFIDENGFEITSLLEINPSVKSTEVLPGKEIMLYGTAQTELEGQIFNGDFEISILDANYRYSFEGKDFKYALLLPKNIKSGTHQLLIRLSDNYGNKGESSVSVIITPILTDITHNLGSMSFLPGETMRFNPTLVDQAGDIINEKISVALSDSIFDSEVMSGESISIFIPGKTDPGVYKLSLISGSIRKKFDITILEKSEIMPYLDGNNLVLSNVGNIKFSDMVTITFNQGIQIKESLSLKPGQNKTIDLSNGLATGRYDIKVSVAGKDHEFSSIDLISAVPFKYKTIVTAIMILVFIIILIIMFLKLRRDHISLNKSGYESSIPRKKITLFKKHSSEVHHPASNHAQGMQKKPYVKLTKEQEIEDYKRTILKEIEKVERESKRERGLF